MMFYITFFILIIISALFQIWASKTNVQISSTNNPQFRKFQSMFLTVYFMVLFSDWLQGPYVYKLYAHYGYDISEIALLYVAGFASSVIFGTTTGPLADRFGRKKMAIIFCVTYSLCCITKLSSNFVWLMIGRILGGISTSLLFSTFESWYIYEHSERHDFPSEWISVTFTKTTFWNGVLAIIAGLASNFLAETLSYGPVSPFMLSIPFLTLAGIIITKNWEENYGNKKINLKTSCMEGLKTILFNEPVLYLGIVQSLFEANMYIFVFQWTPILESGYIPLGIIFACFMVCIMIGSSLNTILLSKKISPNQILLLSVSLAIASMSTCIFSASNNKTISFFSFLILELSVGLYFPTISYLRSQVIPEDLRASIMNWFRVPTNVITCGCLLILHSKTVYGSDSSIFTICTLMLIIALFSNLKFNSLKKLTYNDIPAENVENIEKKEVLIETT